MHQKTDELFSFPTLDLGNLKQWFDSNNVSLNVVKTEYLFIETQHKILLLPSINSDGNSIERVNSF